jgi:hypothetical protein
MDQNKSISIRQVERSDHGRALSGSGGRRSRAVA